MEKNGYRISDTLYRCASGRGYSPARKLCSTRLSRFDGHMYMIFTVLGNPSKIDSASCKLSQNERNLLVYPVITSVSVPFDGFALSEVLGTSNQEYVFGRRRRQSGGMAVRVWRLIAFLAAWKSVSFHPFPRIVSELTPQGLSTFGATMPITLPTSSFHHFS